MAQNKVTKAVGGVASRAFKAVAVAAAGIGAGDIVSNRMAADGALLVARTAVNKLMTHKQNN